MIRLIAIILCGLAAAAPVRSQPHLAEGTWTGTLTPMNHPEMHVPLRYEISGIGEHVRIVLSIPDGEPVLTRGVNLEADTLRFVFNEPEGGVLLTCSLASVGGSGYGGRCVDPAGKWAHFTMQPPED